jgi:hypothetical protein
LDFVAIPTIGDASMVDFDLVQTKLAEMGELLLAMAIGPEEIILSLKAISSGDWTRVLQSLEVVHFGSVGSSVNC